MNIVPFIPIVVGTALLLVGYRYFWLIVAGVGFLVGLNMGSLSAGGQITTSAIVLGLFLGVIGGFTAVFITAIALNIIAFFLGGILMVQLFTSLNWSAGSTLATFILGGVVGLLIAIIGKDYAKMLISAVTGAAIIITALPVDQATTSFLLLGLVLAGVVAQIIVKNRW
ncbi:MAG: hypothetical protein IPM39_02605 [Chloroflexi bacterium]|nr:hypothetical protein [Chloroflexota bacterium]